MLHVRVILVSFSFISTDFQSELFSPSEAQKEWSGTRHWFICQDDVRRRSACCRWEWWRRLVAWCPPSTGRLRSLGGSFVIGLSGPPNPVAPKLVRADYRSACDRSYPSLRQRHSRLSLRPLSVLVADMCWIIIDLTSKLFQEVWSLLSLDFNKRQTNKRREVSAFMQIQQEQRSFLFILKLLRTNSRCFLEVDLVWSSSNLGHSDRGGVGDIDFAGGRIPEDVWGAWKR